MRIAFYAPMKPPDHPVPSGDRAMARLLLKALAHGGHDVVLASRFRTWQSRPDHSRQARMAGLGECLAARLARRYAALPQGERPQAWLTYHLYYKAPDFIGPIVAERLGIPYLLVEASLAYKRAEGPWDVGHRAALAAVEAAHTVMQINPEDAECIPPETRQSMLPAFLDGAGDRRAMAERSRLRNDMAARWHLPLDCPWIVAVAMMREDVKLASYRILADALSGLTALPWRLLLVGDGPARPAVEAAFARALGEANARVRYLGVVPQAAVAEPLAAADLYAWPSINEAYGMALLEAQACGLAVVSGDRPGVTAILRDGETGFLVPTGQVQPFAAALERLLSDPALCRKMGAAAAANAAQRHDLAAAADALSAVLREAVR